MIILLGAAVYGPWLNNGFVLDDEVQLIGNELTTSMNNLGEVFLLGATTHQGGRVNSYGVYYRPMMIGIFTVLRSNFGDNPLPFHLLQLLLHIANAVLIYYLFRKLFSEPDFQWACWFGAVCFLIHPLNGEAVSYIASLQEPLFAFFGLFAMNLVLQRSKTFSIFSMIAVTLCFFLALLGKETAIMLILLSSLAALLFRRDRFVKVMLAGLFATADYLALRWGTAGLTAVDHSASVMARSTLSVKLWSLPAVLSSYIFKFFIPWTLATLQDWVVTGPDLRSFWLPLAGVIAMSLLTLCYAVKSKNKLFLFFAIWTFLTLGLHSHVFVPLDGTVAERWFYLIGIGLIGMVLSALSDYIKLLSGREKWLALGLTVALLVVFAIRSEVRASQWVDGFTLCSADIDSQADSPTLQNNLGVELFRRGEVAQARVRFEKSTELNPAWNINWSNLGATYQRSGNLQKAEEYYRKSTEFGPYILAYQNLESVLVQEGKLAEARKFLYEAALPTYPQDATLLNIAEILKSRPSK